MKGVGAVGAWFASACMGGALALCVASCYSSSSPSNYGGESHFLRPCTKTAQCSDLGGAYACVEGRCRADADAGADAMTVDAMTEAYDGGSAASGQVGASMSDATPLVMLLIDTSGSLERTSNCACTTPGCEECLPDCSRAELNRWAEVLSALTGTFEHFSCEALDRTEENGATYDVGYYLPHYRLMGTQRADGVLDAYRDRLRFGVATFDGFDTFVGAPPLVPVAAFEVAASSGMEGMWSYNPERALGVSNLHDGHPTGEFLYPRCTEPYQVDTGIRSAAAEEGALRVAIDPLHAGEVDDEIQDSLLRLRPYGGTPIASSLDDLYYFLARDPAMEAERARRAPVHVVLVTDGSPDDDYRQFGCNCAHDGDPNDPERCKGEDPARMHCPYPVSEAAANRLRCGDDLEFCHGPAAQLHVVGFAVDDDGVVSELNAIAVAGGDRAAYRASSKDELYGALDEIFATIEASSRQP
jgi:hypothetical protein